jgi:PKD repeat protein
MKVAKILLATGALLSFFAFNGLAITQAQQSLTVSIAGPTEGEFEVGQAIDFTGEASGGDGDYSYTWNFGDGTSSFGGGYSKTYDTAGTYTVTLTVSDFAGLTGSDSKTITVTDGDSNVDPVTATITAPANNATFNVGQAIDFTGEASGGDGDYSYTWNFGDGTSSFGGGYSKTYDTAGTYTVTLTVSDFAERVDSDSINVTIQSGGGEPLTIVDLKANGQDGTISVAANASVNLSWATQNATSCTASGAWSGTKNTGGVEIVGPLSANQTLTYTLTCEGAGGTASDFVTINVGGGGGGGDQVSVDLKANNSDGTITVAPGASVTLSWTSANATSCTASNGWSGSKGTSGSETVTASTASSTSQTYTLTCQGSGGSAADSVTITTTGGGSGDPLTISNIRVTDITQTSVIIRWTTNRAADSRVIYDTVSHPSISGAAAPNYGYAFSTATSDDNPEVIEHAVQVTGLSPNTRYYFRVISED